MEPVQVPLRSFAKLRWGDRMQGGSLKNHPAKPGWVLMETLQRHCGAGVDTALGRSRGVRGRRLPGGRSGAAWRYACWRAKGGWWGRRNLSYANPFSTHTARGMRLTLGGRSNGWIHRFMVSPLQPVFVCQPVEERPPDGKVRRGPALRLLAGQGGMVGRSGMVLQQPSLHPKCQRGAPDLGRARRRLDW